MRIRKNFKISPLYYPASSPNAGAVIQTHYCQLNQSPWDAMNFSVPNSPQSLSPPLPHLSPVDKTDICDRNKSMVDNVQTIVRKVDKDYIFESVTINTTDKVVEQPRVVEDRPTILCSEPNENGLQCRHTTTNSCKHHLNKSNKLMEANHLSQSKKSSTISSSYSNEFYYYSGFGPRWGKRRSESSCEINGSGIVEAVKQHDVTSPALSQFDEEIDLADDAKEKGGKRARKSIK